MDVIDDIVETFQLKGVLYFRTDFSDDWAITVPQYERAARFHLVVHGRCFVTLQSGATVELSPGDLILIPEGRDHILSNQSKPRPAPLEQVIADAGYNGEGVFTLGDGDDSASAQMICGHYTFRNDSDHPLLRALPEFLLVTPQLRAKFVWLDDVLRLIVRQIFSDSDHTNATVRRLSEIIFIETIRACADQSPKLAQIIGALGEKRIGDALLLMHNDLAHPWTLDKLATGVGMSRSKFAEQFKAAIGSGPMTYLSDWRLQKALSYLSGTQINIQEVAIKIGYQSPAAFTRAFSQKFGVSPKEYRRVEPATVH